MGLGRAYGGGLNTANWLVQGSTPYYGVTHEKKASVPLNAPFIIGDGQNRILDDDVCGVITLNALPARSLG